MEEKQVNSKFRIPNSVFLIISGASILGFWTMFIITDPNSLFRHGIINGIFHLFSEGSLAVICILTAFGLIMKISIGYKWKGKGPGRNRTNRAGRATGRIKTGKTDHSCWRDNIC